MATEDIEQQRTHYERYYQEDQSKRHWDDSHFKRPFEQAFVDRCHFSSDSHVFEAGCGHGLLTARLLEQCGRVTAVDLAESGLAEVAGRFPTEVDSGKLELVCGDIHEILSQRQGVFDGIVGAGILHHLDDLPRNFSAMFAALRPGGWIGFGPEPNASGLYRYAWRYVAGPVSRLMGHEYDWEVERRTLNMRTDLLRRMLTDCGFDNIEIHPYQFLPHFGLKGLRALDLKLIGRSGLGPYGTYLSIHAQRPRESRTHTPIS